MKNGCAMIFHALEGLLARPKGFKPRRGLYVAIGHDEEVGGSLGAKVCGFDQSRVCARLGLCHHPKMHPLK
jgi:acetylornithine deacetylase/succinyl-diaminopimelate desuccinylase-like protein